MVSTSRYSSAYHFETREVGGQPTYLLQSVLVALHISSYLSILPLPHAVAIFPQECSFFPSASCALWRHPMRRSMIFGLVGSCVHDSVATALLQLTAVIDVLSGRSGRQVIVALLTHLFLRIPLPRSPRTLTELYVLDSDVAKVFIIIYIDYS
ncbi:hypothetical protein MSAN_02433100 [Mycena sanguinolenta]|uniref:Uncharacterized protein n=1 Tax=Mycena sanguinolenta TaxID=230812 RepID=A0A8H7CDQ6_9AGAR|nr:hypothetical protein MSAN_02433100 [Mycena sanguinolenta]